jgi:hypothetical protein
MALLSATENTSALHVLNGQFLELCELEYWHGTVLNVAHGMIPVCMKFTWQRRPDLQESERASRM